MNLFSMSRQNDSINDNASLVTPFNGQDLHCLLKSIADYGNPLGREGLKGMKSCEINSYCLRSAKKLASY